MKTKKAAFSLPLIAGIVLGIATLATPFLLANHYLWVEGTRYSADNYLFFFWGKYYTVAGANLIQHQTVLYDLGDYPIYAMAAIVIALIFSTMSIFAGKGMILNVKGRQIALKFDVSPIWLQATSSALLVLSYIYMMVAGPELLDVLKLNNYVTETGPSLEILLGSIVAIILATIITVRRSLGDRKEGNKEEDIKDIGKVAV